MTSERTLTITLPKLDKRGLIAVLVMWLVVAAIILAAMVKGPVVILWVVLGIMVVALAAIVTAATYFIFRKREFREL